MRVSRASERVQGLRGGQPNGNDTLQWRRTQREVVEREGEKRMERTFGPSAGLTGRVQMECVCVSTCLDT